MNPVQQRPRTPAIQPETQNGTVRNSASLPTWRLNVMRVGYFVMGAGLAVTKWPELAAHEPWELKEGTVVTMLVALSVLALLGLRYPQRMLRRPGTPLTRHGPQPPLGGRSQARRPEPARGGGRRPSAWLDLTRSAWTNAHASNISAG